LLISGDTPPFTGATEEYDGTSWTTVNSMNTARWLLGGNGIQTAALAVGGLIPPAPSAATEEYNGTSWTNSNNLNTSRYFAISAGTQTAGLAFGGKDPSPTGATEEYDGNSWIKYNKIFFSISWNTNSCFSFCRK
jgi:hypothetical protein